MILRALSRRAAREAVLLALLLLALAVFLGGPILLLTLPRLP